MVLRGQAVDTPHTNGIANESSVLVRPEDEVGRFDVSYVGALVFLRWAILATYVGIVVGGFVPMNAWALAGSAGWIALTNVAALFAWQAKRRVPWYDKSYLFLDALAVTFAVLASASLRYPIWLAYVMVMSAAAAEQNSRYSGLFDVFCVALYLGCASIMRSAGWYRPDTGVLVVTAAIMFFVGSNLTITFDGSRRMRAYIRSLAVTDPLTGLANRRRLTESLSAVREAESAVAVVVFDIDNFKRYNDARGHLAGDQLLVRFARALEAGFPDAHALSRYGGDEFVALLPEERPGAVESRVERLVAESNEHDIPVSAGIAIWPGDEPTLDAALAAADDCLRMAKMSRKGSLVSAGALARAAAVAR